MRIGINALYLLPGRVGGTEIYLRSLLTALSAREPDHEFFVFVNRETGADLVPAAPGFHLVRCGVNATSRPWRLAYEQFVLPVRLLRLKIDVLLNPGFTAPVLASCPSVTVFHDLQHKRHPEFFRWFDLPFWNLFLWLSIRRSQLIIAVSEATAGDLLNYFPGAKEKLIVIHHGVDPEFFRISSRRHVAPNLLTVSTLHPHKNICRMLEAFYVFRQRNPEYRLTIAGLKGFAADSIDARVRALGLSDSVRITGWIPRGELYGLFEICSALIAPSLFEGFGMPVVEALAAGIPVACSAISAFAEVAADAAIYFDPLSVDSICSAMERTVHDSRLRDCAQIAGPRQARRFDWGRCAEDTLRQLTRAAR